MIRTLRSRIPPCGAVLAAALACTAPVALGATCPKLLMFDGTAYTSQTNVRDAAYWGRTVGIQGFLLNDVMAYWQARVGTNPESALWQEMKQFQQLYSRYGVTDNFIKVAIYKPHDWESPAQNAQVVQNFAHAAALARYAGFTGVALDLEPHVPTWGNPGDDPGLATTVEDEGRAIGVAMHAAYPGMTLIVMPDVTLQVYREGLNPERPRRGGGYGLAVPFVQGLLSVQWTHMVLATEEAYNGHIAPSIELTRRDHAELTAAAGDASADFSVAPGLWPLGLTYTDKSGRKSPEDFARRLGEAFAMAKRYVWIYGKGSAWQTGGPYGAGPVANDFQQYVDAIHRVRANCGAGE